MRSPFFKVATDTCCRSFWMPLNTAFSVGYCFVSKYRCALATISLEIDIFSAIQKALLVPTASESSRYLGVNVSGSKAIAAVWKS